MTPAQAQLKHAERNRHEAEIARDRLRDALGHAQAEFENALDAEKYWTRIVQIEKEEGSMRPGLAICRDVVYRSKTGTWSVPAKIVATIDTLYKPNVEAGHVPPLSSDDHVHLVCFTPGLPGHVSDETKREHPELTVQVHAPGIFQEHDVPFWQPQSDAYAYDEQPPGTWTWPARR